MPALHVVSSFLFLAMHSLSFRLLSHSSENCHQVTDDSNEELDMSFVMKAKWDHVNDSLCFGPSAASRLLVLRTKIGWNWAMCKTVVSNLSPTASAIVVRLLWALTQMVSISNCHPTCQLWHQHVVSLLQEVGPPWTQTLSKDCMFWNETRLWTTLSLNSYNWIFGNCSIPVTPKMTFKLLQFVIAFLFIFLKK